MSGIGPCCGGVVVGRGVVDVGMEWWPGWRYVQSFTPNADIYHHNHVKSIQT